MNLRAVASVLATTTVHTRHEAGPADRADLLRLATGVVTPLRGWIDGLATALNEVDHAVTTLAAAPDGDTGRDRLALRDGLVALRRHLTVLVADPGIPQSPPEGTAEDGSGQHPIG